MTENFVNYCNCICQSVTCSCAKEIELNPDSTNSTIGNDDIPKHTISAEIEPIVFTCTSFGKVPPINSVQRVLEILEHLHHLNFQDAMQMFFNEHKPIEEIFKEVWPVLPEHLKSSSS